MQLYIGNLALAPILSNRDYHIDIEDASKWRAGWLESDFTSTIWKFKNHKTPLSFEAHFVNGEQLTDPSYSSLCNTIKKIVFLKRSGHLADLTGKASSRSATQHQLGKNLIMMAQFLVNNGHYKVGEGFSSMTQSTFHEFMMLYVDSGSDGVSGHFDIIRNELQKLQDAGQLHLIVDSKGVFESKAFVRLTGVKSGLVDYLSSLSKDKLKSYCLFKEHTKALYSNKSEFNNATPLKTTRQQGRNPNGEDVSKVSDTMVGALVGAVNALSHYKVPLQYAELSSFNEFRAVASDYAGMYYESRRTPDIPVDIALAYIDSAVEFVHAHGKNIVLTLADCKKQVAQQVAMRKSPRKDHVMKAIEVPVNSTTKHFNMSRYNALPKGATPNDKRKYVSLELLLEVYQSAVFILLTTFACKRFNDVMSLKHGANTIGYNGLSAIKFGLSKASPNEILRAVGRPVPNVVADAFDNLVEINELLLENNATASTSLFQGTLFLPPSLSATDENEISRDVLIKRLISFADFVEIPTVKKGGTESRWYLNRMHMLRRFFACTYYRTNGKKSLPALTWLMGHKDTKETMHYVTKNLANSDMTLKEGAKIVASVLTDLDAEDDLVQKLSELFGEHVGDISLPENVRRLERRIEEYIRRGYSIIKRETGELVLLQSQNVSEVKQDA